VGATALRFVDAHHRLQQWPNPVNPVYRPRMTRSVKREQDSVVALESTILRRLTRNRYLQFKVVCSQAGYPTAHSLQGRMLSLVYRQ